MQVSVDEIWASPSVLHMRVLVWPNGRTWMQKHYVAVPLDNIPDQALATLVGHALGDQEEEPAEQGRLF